MNFIKTITLFAFSIVFSVNFEVLNGQPAGLSADVSEYVEAIKEGNERKKLMLQKQLLERGEPVVDALMGCWDESNPQLNLGLLDAVRRIGSPKVQGILIELVVQSQNPKIVQFSANSLGNAIVQREFTEEEENKLIELFKNSSGIYGAQIAWIFANSKHGNKAKLAIPLAERTVNEIKQIDNIPKYANFGGRYTDDTSVHLAHFLRAIRLLNNSDIANVFKGAIEDVEDFKRKKWLTIAAGMAGDKDVESDLRKIVEDESENLSIRASALRALAVALGPESRPLLEKYKNNSLVDPAVSERHKPLRIVARDELAELRKKE